MIVSKSNLHPVELIKGDSKIPVLNNVHIDPNGATIVRNGKVLLCVTPVVQAIKDKIKGFLPDTGKNRAITIPAENIKQVVKDLPNDKTYAGLLEHTDLKAGANTVKFTLTNGKVSRNLQSKLYEKPYINYPEALKEVFKSLGKGKRVVLDLNRLLAILQTIKKVCPDTSGDLPVFIEFTKDNDVLIRAKNPKSLQQVVALMTSYKGIESKWLSLSKWEKQFLPVINKLKKFKLKRKK